MAHSTTGAPSGVRESPLVDRLRAAIADEIERTHREASAPLRRAGRIDWATVPPGALADLVNESARTAQDLGPGLGRVIVSPLESFLFQRCGFDAVGFIALGGLSLFAQGMAELADPELVLCEPLALLLDGTRDHPIVIFVCSGEETAGVRKFGGAAVVLNPEGPVVRFLGAAEHPSHRTGEDLGTVAREIVMLIS
jgi:hypothetical protein